VKEKDMNEPAVMDPAMSYIRADLPPIAIRPRDIEQLGRLANAAMDKYPQTAEFLAREVDRAEILTSVAPPEGLVGMGSRVEFRCDGDGAARVVTLVYPHEADTAAGKISVLTPIGAALIGLSVGQSIEWQSPAGEWRSVTVLRADPPDS
jgi:regulator of nucleoside diphosphate kinase